MSVAPGTAVRRARGALAAVIVAAAVVAAPAQESARALLDRGLGLRGPDRQGEAMHLFEQAIAAAAIAGDQPTEGDAWRALASARTTTGDVTGGAEAWTRATAIYTGLQDWMAVGATATQRALAAYRRRAYDDAERWWLSALGTFERAGLIAEQARSLRSLSFLPRLTTRERMALASQAIDLAAVAGNGGVEGESRHQLSDLLVLDGDLAGAAAQLDAALPLLEASDLRIATGRALTSLGRVRRMFGRPQDSIALNTRAAAMLEAAGDGPGAAQALDAVTRAWGAIGDGRRMVEAGRAALALARRVGDQDAVANCLTRLARLLPALNQADEAAALIDEAEPLARSTAQRDNLAAARAAVAMARQRPMEAVAALDTRHWETLPLDDQMEHWAMRGQAWTAAQRGEEARASFERAAGIFDREASSLVPDDAAKRGYFERTTAIVSRHVSVLVELGDAGRALQAAERGRARAFVDLLASRRLEEAARASSSRATASPAASNVVSPSAALPPAATSAPSSEPPTIAALVVRGGGRATPVAPEPAIASAASTAPPTLDEITSVTAAAGSHLLAYWVTGNEIDIWVVAPDGHIALRRSPVARRDLDALASDLGIASNGRSRRASRRLYDLLVAPVRDLLPKAPGRLVTVIPHGPLVRVSLAALSAPNGRYLIEDFRLHYAPSIATLRSTARVRPAATAAVVVADPAGGITDANGRPLPRLPAARADANAIARLLGPDQVTVLSGGIASEGRVRAAVPHAGIVHFATHGVVSDDRPWTSYLAVAPDADPSSPAADGRLTAGELYDLRLDASLVVIGACRSATGPVTGDGITGLARAFVAAGAPTVVASLWDLPDSVTAELQPAFYRRWRTSHSAADALRDAQLDVLRRLRAGRISVDTPAGRIAVPEDPTLWAGLVVIGQP